jgi:hypothetical protein
MRALPKLCSVMRRVWPCCFYYCFVLCWLQNSDVPTVMYFDDPAECKVLIIYASLHCLTLYHILQIITIHKTLLEPYLTITVPYISVCHSCSQYWNTLVLSKLEFDRRGFATILVYDLKYVPIDCLSIKWVLFCAVGFMRLQHWEWETKF